MSARATVLIVDDLPEERRLLHFALKDRFDTLEAGDAGEALRHLDDAHADVVLLDLHLPPRVDHPDEGVRLHAAIHERAPELPIVIVTGDEDRAVALEAVERGVADFLLKPIDGDVLKTVVGRALERARLERELRELRRQVHERFSFQSLVGESAAARKVFSKLERLAGVRTTVLLLGESGTGKSAVARALHFASPRADGPFVVVDGASIPETLLESELFGHAKGAFTGADAAKAGKLRRADGGTLFLDEIANLSREAQAKLLLFLDSRSFTPVGSDDPIEVDVRLVAATNQDLDRLVAEDRFRADLLYRIQVATVTLPPLRERAQDIAPLCRRLLAELCREAARAPVELSPDAYALLESYPWPGNVRQLRHVLESSLVLADGDVLAAGDFALPPYPGARPGPGAPTDRDAAFKQKVLEYERRLLTEALAGTRGNKAAAGRRLGLDENQIRYLCRKHGLD
jgi:DNA-binding NtrC family response regulator